VTTAQVTAVIPTTGRPQLSQAVESVLRQSIATKVVVVEADPLKHGSIEKQLEDLGGDVTLLAPGQHLLASAARNLGTDAVQTPFVAYLDDDDWWEEGKVAAQLAALNTVGLESVVCATDSLFIRSDTLQDVERSRGRIVPVIPYKDGSVADYLLRRPRIRYGHHFMQSSSLLLSTELARSVRWDNHLAKHEDWDIIIRLIDKHGASYVHVPEVLTFVRKGSPGSLSKVAAPLDSLGWLTGIDCSTFARNDFILSIVIRPGLAARDMVSVRAGFRAMRWAGGMSLAALVGLASGLVKSIADEH
jgi:glycosyltransferase involved in cell wall biosynthesis